MRNLTLAADWNDFSLFDDYEAARIENNLVPSDLRRRLSAWNSEYRAVIGTTGEESASSRVQIASLDADGRALAAELKQYFPDAQLRYASEGNREPASLGTLV